MGNGYLQSCLCMQMTRPEVRKRLKMIWRIAERQQLDERLRAERASLPLKKHNVSQLPGLWHLFQLFLRAKGQSCPNKNLAFAKKHPSCRFMLWW